jgi:transcriptional regulator with XRE-family HTH domain
VSNVVFSSEYQAITTFLTELRMEAGVSQRELARRIGRSQSHVQKIESRQRRVEIIEFCRLVQALGFDPERAFSGLVRRVRTGQ